MAAKSKKVYPSSHAGTWRNTQDNTTVVFSKTSKDSTKSEARCTVCGSFRHDTTNCKKRDDIVCVFCHNRDRTTGISTKQHTIKSCHLLPSCKKCQKPHAKEVPCSREPCANCGHSGTHFSASCTETSCDKCGSYVHETSQCLECRTCGLWGHIAPKCTTPFCYRCNKLQVDGSLICSECKSTCNVPFCKVCESEGYEPWGHLPRDVDKCPSIVCDLCNTKGHHRIMCTTPFCYKCQMFQTDENCSECGNKCNELYCTECANKKGADPWGHKSYSKFCPNTTCRYCGEFGHVESDAEKCSVYYHNPKFISKSRRGEKPRSNYQKLNQRGGKPRKN